MSYIEREQSVFAGQPFELYLFETLDESWRLTSSDQVRSGPLGPSDLYTPTAMMRTALGKGPEDKANSLTVTIPRDHALAQQFIGYMPVTPLTLIIYRGHEGESETIVQFTGGVTSAKFDEDCELNCAPEEQCLQQKIPRMKYQTPCNKIIYSLACGATKISTSATVSAVAGDVVSAGAFSGHADGWFNNGYLEWGNFKRMIIHHVSNDVTLLAPILGLTAGQAVVAYRGCNRTFAECVGIFANGPNFWGFEWIPVRNPFKGVEW
jgi:uncharacterized phage protein (TIGR02218 family)